MSRRLAWILLGLALLHVGCSEPAPPPQGSIPEIPPGRSSLQTGEQSTGGKSSQGLVPKPPEG